MCMEDTLKTLRKQWGAGKHGDRPSPLGLSKGWRDARDAQRQASAVSLRPVRIKMDDKAVLMPVVYECNAGLHPTIEPTGGLDGFPIEGGANLRKL